MSRLLVCLCLCCPCQRAHGLTPFPFADIPGLPPPPVCRASSTDRLLPSPADSDSAPADSDSAPVVLDGAAAPPYQDDADAVPAAHPLVQLMKAAE